MGKSYFPTSEAQQSAWAANYKAKIVDVAGSLGLTEEQVNRQKSNCEKLISSIDNVSVKRSDLKLAIGARNTTIATDGGSLRADISNIKTLPGYTVGIGEALQIISPSTSADYATFKPVLTAETFGSKLRLRFKKMETDGVNIYRKKTDSSEWQFVARANKSPYDQSYINTIPGQPELWQYRAFGVVNDNEIGQASAIIEVIYPA